MRGTMTIVHPSTDVEHHRFDRPVLLRELNCAVGGPVELVPGFNRWEGRPCVVFCNEVGKLEGRPMNATATALWFEALGYDPGDRLVGPVAIVTGSRDFMENL